MRFWDSSALVPLLAKEDTTEKMIRLMEEDPVVLVSWISSVEIMSALCRRKRMGELDGQEFDKALAIFDQISAQWIEVQPSDLLRNQAIRVLRVHHLRTLDSFQLASAIIVSDYKPQNLLFVCLDHRLIDAAKAEGFSIRDKSSSVQS